MTSKTPMEFNLSEAFEEFKQFSLKEMTRAYKKALGAGGRVIVSKAKQTLAAKVNSHGHPTYWNGSKFIVASDTLSDAVRMSILNKKGYGQNQEAFVHIMGTRKTGSGTFITRFFENGTKERYRKTDSPTGKFKKGRWLGSIKPTHFFSDAVSSSYADAMSKIETTLYQTIDKINQSKVA